MAGNPVDLTKFQKFDQRKPRMELIDPESLEELAKVLSYGAEKYEDENWRLGVNDPKGEKRVIGALMRHLTAHQKGELFDPETKLLHVSHLFCNAMFLVWFILKKSKKPEEPRNQRLCKCKKCGT